MKKLHLLLLCALFPIFSFGQSGTNQTDFKGLKQGKWVGRYPAGNIKYEGSFLENKPVGAWKRYHENGKVKALLFYRPGSDRVAASLFDEEGRLYARGIFAGTLRDSIWNFFNGEQIVQTERYLLGKKEGKSSGFDQAGKLIWEKTWKNDLQEGYSADYYPSGIKRSETIFVAGQKNGPARFFDANGNLFMEGGYTDNLSDGAWKVYDTSGKLKYQLQYKRGEILNGEALDSLQMREFKQYDAIKGRIPEPKANEQGLPDIH